MTSPAETEHVSGESPQDRSLLRRIADLERSDWVEIAAALLLALATVMSAWAAYQATRWTGVQATAFGTASTLRAESVRASNLASAQRQIDIASLMQWINATAEDRQALADLYEGRFRDEFRPAFEAWLETAGADGIPPGTPFSMREYRLQYEEEADALEAQAAASFAEAKEANQTGDNFVLTAVMMASVLFFAGIGTKFRPPIRQILLGIGVVLFLAGAVIIVLLPQNVGF